MAQFKKLLISLAVLLIAFSVKAQNIDSMIVKNPVRIGVEERELGGEVQKVFSLFVMNSSIDEVEKAWDKYMESGNKVKMVADGSYRTMEGAINKNIDPNQPIDIFSELAQGRKGVFVYVAIRLPDSTWISPEGNADKTIRTEKILMRFGKLIYKEYLMDELKDQENKLDDLEKDYNGILKKQTNLKKEIQSDSLEIFNIENDIKAAKENYKSVADELSRKEREMRNTEFTSDDAKKIAEKELKDLQKEKKRIAKSIEKMQNDVIEVNNNIVEADYYLQLAKEDEQKVLEKIFEQKKIVDKLREAIEAFEE